MNIKEIKESRTASFIVMFAVYLFASAVGIVCYYFFKMDFWLNLFVSDVIATVFVFVLSLIFKNASVYDPYWSVQPIIILAAFSIKYGASTPVIFLLIAVCIWGTRLTANWAYTFKGLKYQDWRYTMLNENTGKFYPLINFIGIHMIPTIVVYACILPAVYVVMEKPEFNAFSIIPFVFCLLAVTLQGVSDIQMHEYRKNRTQSFMRKGLWKHSRHPNYLGEITMWWGVGVFSVILLPDRWYLLCGAFLNTLLFLFVSIPMADKRQSKKEGFIEYKKETHMLLPLPKLFKK